MENFSVKLSGLNTGIDQEEKVINSLSQLESSISDVRRNMGMRIGSSENISGRIADLADAVNGYRSDISNLRNTLIYIHSQYERTENNICGNPNGYNFSLSDIFESLTTEGCGLAISALNQGRGSSQRNSAFLDYINNHMHYVTEKHRLNNTYSIWNSNNPDPYVRDNLGHRHYERENGHWVLKEQGEAAETPSPNKMLENLTLFRAYAGKEYSLYHDNILEGENYSVSGDILNARSYASASITAGGLDAMAGASVTLASLKASGRLGDDNFGVHGSAQIDVGRVGANAGINVGWLDENGNFNPRASLSASAEAILIEASASAALDIAGADVGVTGKVNFGIGAHADIGYNDGVFSLDIGASLGVGGSVKLDIDLSGVPAVSETIDKVADFAYDVGDTAKQVCDAAADCISTTVGAVGDFVGDTTDAIGDFLSGAKDWFSW